MAEKYGWNLKKARAAIFTLQLINNNMRPIHILLVEDNEGDIFLTTEALEDAKLVIKLSVARDGKEAVDFVNRQGKYIDADLPDMILMDINLPKRNGHEVLKYIKENESLKHIPVIMLTTSSSERDINASYNNYANCFITKPVEVSEFIKLIATIENFWIAIVKLPAQKIYK
jgi:CheY-like chemotaxis protein